MGSEPQFTAKDIAVAHWTESFPSLVDAYLRGIAEQDLDPRAMGLHHAREKPSLGATKMPTLVTQLSDLYPTVELLFENYGGAECAKTGRPLFDDQARRILNAINAGEVFDPFGIYLYFEIGVDQHNLPLYRCCRGTNALEGGVHQNIIRKFASFNAGSHMTDCMLAGYRLRHNIDVGSTE